MLIRKHNCYFFDSLPSQQLSAGFSVKPWNHNFRNQTAQEFCKSISQFASVCEFEESKIAFFDQVHGSDSVRLEPSLAYSGLQRFAESGLIRADAAYTDGINVPILIFTADCVPLFVTAKDGKIIALLHVGWKGAHAGIVAKAINEMSHTYDLQPQEFICMIGPSIRSCCYEVGMEFKKYFQNCVTTKEKKLFFNLPQLICQDLDRLGISEKQVVDTAFCTGCDLRFHSYRREGERAGRMASFIVKRGY